AKLRDIRSANLQALDDLDAQLNALMSADSIQFDANDQALETEIEALLQVDAAKIEAAQQIGLLEVVDVASEADWSQYMVSTCRYATKNGVDLSGDPFSRLMTESQRLVVERRIDEDLTHKNANCDKYDYMLAATCGMVAGLIDVLFVGLPGQGAIGNGADKAVDSAVIGFAKLLGWKGPREGRDPKASAIGFLERKFKVNYDQTHGN